MNDVLFLTYGAYGNNTKILDFRKRNAKKFGIDLYILGEGTEWQGLYGTKTLAFYNKLLEFRGIYKYCIAVDARDTAFIDTKDNILEQFHKIYDGRVIFCTDHYRPKWHFTADWFLDMVEQHYTGWGFANTGLIAGEIEKILKIYEHLLGIYHTLKHTRLRIDFEKRNINIPQMNTLTKLESIVDRIVKEDEFRPGKHIHNANQFLLYILQTQGYVELIKPDIERELFAKMYNKN